MQNITFQSTFDTPTVRASKLNSKAMTPDGRIWEYLKATEGITQYMTVSSPANTDADTIASSASTQDPDKHTFLLQASAGWTIGAYQDHWILVDDGIGEGQVGKVKDNTADTLELFFDHAFTTALTVAGVSDIVIRHEPDVEMVADTTLITPCKGVAQVTFVAADFGWFLKRGIGGVLAGEAITINTTMGPGDDTEGTVEITDTGQGSYDTVTVGRCLVANASVDKACLADVNIR